VSQPSGGVAPAPGSDAEARARLHRLAADHEGWDRLAELYEALAEDAHTAEAAADLLMEVAAIRDKQGQPARAEAQYRRILGMRPDDSAARAKLEALYRNGGRWVELAASLEERTDPRLGTAAPEAERPALLRELAAIYVDHLAHPHDGIDTLERLRHLAPTDVGVLEDLGGLYARVGRWSKVIETHARIGEIAEGTPQARDALRKVATIYETELELPERAIDTYQQLVAQWPDDADAFAALDRLCEAQARWTDLVEVLRRRSAMATSPQDRARLLARRAGVLMEWLSAPEEAASALRHARTIMPEDGSLADRLVTALYQAARHREAAAVLEGRIASSADKGLGAGELAALHIRLAQIRAEGLGDTHGARTALDHALKIVPEHPTALAALSRLTAGDEDPRAFIAAKLREADAASDDDVKIDALYAAGIAQRDRTNDPGAARAAFERILAIRPYHADAIWALAGLIEQGGDPDTAAKLLETRLDGELAPPERARVLTQLAALARAAGVELVAERRLAEALDADGGHVPALIALADLYADSSRWDDLEKFLKDTLAEGVPGTTPAMTAELHRRLAQAYEKLGRDDDAYETLLTADRLHRGHLLIKLALGENRYKARRWREAALHLSALATHEEAARHASDVAVGIYHAALAEIRSLRPEKAPPLYTRALELRPNYAPALQAMAELAMEQNDPRKAADLLTRQAMATDDPAERMRLFEALGDMALMMLSDEERARVCYEAAVSAAQPLEARHLPLLEKLLERQDLAGDSLGAGKTAELMSAFGTTAGERAARLARAASDYLAGGDKERARGAAERALAADPYDLGAVEIASQLQVEGGAADAAAEVLGRALSGKEDGDETVRARKAALWFRLGDIRKSRGDAKSSLVAYERAIALGPDTDAAVTARRALAAAYAGDAGKKAELCELRRAIAAATGTVEDIAAWSDELRRAGKNDATHAALDLAIAMGHKADIHQAAFLSIQKVHTWVADESYRGTIGAEGRAAYLSDPDDLPLGPVFAALAEAASLLWPDPEEALAMAGIEGARRLTATTGGVAAVAFPRIAAALGTGAVLLYGRDQADAPDATIVCAGTPIVVLGPRVTAEAGSVDGATRFALGRVAELSRPERFIVAGLAETHLRAVFAALVRSFAPAASHNAVRGLFSDADIQRVRDDQVRGALSVKLRSRFEQLLAAIAPHDLDLARYATAGERVSDRAGLLVSGDPAAAIAAAAARGDGPDAVVAAVTDPAYPTLRALLGVGVRG
jgi:tetratricopeptide (TPR) repeat protein